MSLDKPTLPVCTSPTARATSTTRKRRSDSGQKSTPRLPFFATGAAVKLRLMTLYEFAERLDRGEDYDRDSGELRMFRTRTAT